MNCLVDIHAKFFLCIDSGGKGLLPGFHLHSRLFCAKFVVNDLQRSGFLHRTVRCSTVGTIYDLTCSSIHSLKERLALNILKVQAAEPFEIHSSIRFFQQHACASLAKVKRGGTVENKIKTYLAYALKNADCVLEVPNMKDRDDKLDIGVVTDTVNRIESTGLAEGILLRCTLKAQTSLRWNG